MAQTGSMSSKLYGQAMTELRARHAEEFAEILEGLYKEAGLSYVRKLTKEEREAKAAAEKQAKAAEQIAKLVEQYGPGVLPTST